MKGHVKDVKKDEGANTSMDNVRVCRFSRLTPKSVPAELNIVRIWMIARLSGATRNDEMENRERRR